MKQWFTQMVLKRHLPRQRRCLIFFQEEESLRVDPQAHPGLRLVPLEKEADNLDNGDAEMEEILKDTEKHTRLVLKVRGEAYRSGTVRSRQS